MSAQRSIANRATQGRAGGGWWRGCSAGECSGMRRRAGSYLHHAYLCALRLHCVCSLSFNGRHLTDTECHDQCAHSMPTDTCPYRATAESNLNLPGLSTLSNAGIRPKLHTHLPPTLRVLQVPPSIPVACRGSRRSLQYHFLAHCCQLSGADSCSDDVVKQNTFCLLSLPAVTRATQL